MAQQRLDPEQIADIEGMITFINDPTVPREKIALQNHAVKKLAKVYCPLLLKDDRYARMLLQKVTMAVTDGEEWIKLLQEIELWLSGEPEPPEPPKANPNEGVAVTGEARLK